MDNNLKIVNYLGKNFPKEFTMHELSKIQRIPYASFYRAVIEMRDILKIQKVGKSKVLGLNLSYPTVKSYLAIASNEEKEDFLKRQPIIKKIASELDTKEVVVLFGSYAKEMHINNSDIDMLIINKNGDRSISFSKYEIIFKKKINPIFITRSEFIIMVKEKEENIGNQALKDHIILNNPELFWEMVLDGIS
jgi:predicted nucleotidyltransferase